MSDERNHRAESFLQEAVYRARARQAADTGLSGSRLDRPVAPGGCGLGEDVAHGLELTERGEELFRELWPRPLAPTELARIQGAVGNWVDLQDALDRKRNHFLRDFRKTHGFDRREYSPEDSEAFENGLERINDESKTRLRDASQELLRDA